MKDYLPYTERPRHKLRWSPGCHIMLVAACLIIVFSGILFFIRQRLSILSFSPPRQAVLAVLPFENISGERRQDQISDGLTDELIARLGALEPDRLKVIPRTTAFQYKGKPLRVDKVGRELRADYILTGTIRQDGSRVRVSAALLRVIDRMPLWTENYDRELGAIVEVQNDLVRSVAGRINISPGHGN